MVLCSYKITHGKAVRHRVFYADCYRDYMDADWSLRATKIYTVDWDARCDGCGAWSNRANPAPVAGESSHLLPLAERFSAQFVADSFSGNYALVAFDEIDGDCVCTRCGHTWRARPFLQREGVSVRAVYPRPKRCAKCRSPYWDKARAYRLGREDAQPARRRKAGVRVV